MLSDIEEGRSQDSVKLMDVTQHTLVLKLKDNEISEIARLVAREGMSREESVWVLANMGLMLRRAVVGRGESCWARLPPTVIGAPAHLEMQPSVLEVEGVARQITKSKLSMLEIHYRLAQHLYLLHIIGSEILGPKPFTE